MDGFDGKLFEGWTDGETWNGWAIPRFEFEVALKVLKELEKDDFSWGFDETDRSFSIVEPNRVEDVYVVPVEAIRVGKQVKEVWSIGGMAYTWYEKTNRDQ